MQTLRKAEHMHSAMLVNGPNKLINNRAESDTLGSGVTVAGGPYLITV